MQRHWAVIAAFFKKPEDKWIDDFVQDDRFVFGKVPAPSPPQSWHSKTSRTTSLGNWWLCLRQAWAAYRGGPDGIICCFPQLAMCAAALKKLRRRKPMIVAYNFNLGGFPGGARQRLARWVAGQIDCIVVHSPQEVASYARYLGIPEARVRFVPLQRGEITQTRCENVDQPFLLSMGSAHRDYETLIRAVEPLGIPTTIVTRASDIAALTQGAHVTFLSNLTQQDCNALLAQSRMSVTPISNLETASGQITFVTAMHLGVPVIATACPGTDGYIEDGDTGILVPPFDVEALREAIDALWNDAERRQALTAAGLSAAKARFSDDAAARALRDILVDIDPSLPPLSPQKAE